MIDCYTVRSTNSILTAITLTDTILFVILAMEVELQAVNNFTGFFRQTVFLHQRHNCQFHRSQSSRQFQNHTAFTILQLLFAIRCAHDAKEHTVNTDSVLDIPAGSVGEALSVPMQQTARYIRDYGNEVTDDERTAIEKVLDCDAIAQSYMPELSDGVKQYYKNPGKGDLTRYMLVWAKMLLKHPVCYFEATHANSHGYYTITKCRAINDYYTFNNDICMEMSEMNVHYLDKSGYLRYAFVQALSAFEKLPLVGLTTSIGFMAWLTAVLGLWLARCKAKPVLPVFIGLGIFWLTCIASPVNDCMRYFLPVAGCLPLVFCLAAVFSREKSEITV